MSERYDAGILNDYGGGDVEWWQDYLRAEIERANDYHADIHSYNDQKIEKLKEALEPFISGSNWGAIKAAIVAYGRPDLAKSLTEKQVRADKVMLLNFPSGDLEP